MRGQSLRTSSQSTKIRSREDNRSRPSYNYNSKTLERTILYRSFILSAPRSIAIWLILLHRSLCVFGLWYTPTKAAIVGFANCLQHELLTTKPNLHIQVAFPADTQTPGYEEELKMIPAITKALNETSGLANPQEYVLILYCIVVLFVWLYCSVLYYCWFVCIILNLTLSSLSWRLSHIYSNVDY